MTQDSGPEHKSNRGHTSDKTVQYIAAGCKMQAGTDHMERHNQVVGRVYRNICAECGLEVPKSKWEIPPKLEENDKKLRSCGTRSRLLNRRWQTKQTLWWSTSYRRKQ